MTDEEIKDMIKRHEGYRDRVYLDTKGIPTAGYGHAFLDGSRITRMVADLLFEMDSTTAFRDYEKLNLNLDPIRRGALIDLLFNMGITRLRKFKRMLSHLENRDFDGAAFELEASAYFDQVGPRALEIQSMLRHGRAP